MKTGELIEALSRPQAYPHPVERIEFRQTHISLLFFAGDRVYKIKKPIRLNFLDYSTLARRKHFCEEEVRLNRRLAADIYLGVVTIGRSADRHVQIGGPGDPIEYAVEMVRLPEESMLETQLTRGEIDNRLLNDIVDVLHLFHARAATGPDVDPFGALDAVQKKVLDNLQEVAALTAASRARAGDTTAPSPALLEHLVEWAQRFVLDRAALLEARVAAGRIREGHGDLHCGNICVFGPQRQVIIYDCIEFSRAFRCQDVASEIAFLAMDLDRRGYRGFALPRPALRGDHTRPRSAPASGLLQVALRRRARKVALLEAADRARPAPERTALHRQALDLLHLAASYTLPPVLIVMCGLPGSGKSWAARHLAKPFEAVVLRSDVIRKRLAGLDPLDRAAKGQDQGIYSPNFTQRTYDALRDEAQGWLERGRSVIVDATFARQAWRDRFVSLATALGTPSLLVFLRADEALTERRLRARAKNEQEVSDADLAVFRAARLTFEEPDEIPERQRLDLVGEGAPKSSSRRPSSA